MPCSPTHFAVSREPEPHQIRSASPGDCGWIGSVPRAGPAAGVGVDDAGARDRGHEHVELRARDVGVVQALGRRVAERLEPAAGRLGRAAADAELQAAAAEQIRDRRVLGHVERVLVAKVDDAGADLDAARAHADRREQRERRRQLPGEVMDAHERTVHTELLGSDRELDRLRQRVRRGPRLRPLGTLPVAEREKADALHHAAM